MQKQKLIIIEATIVLISTILISLSYAQTQQATMPYTSTPTVVVDGIIDAGEYEGSYNEATTGVTIYWEHNATNMYVAIQSPGTGWIGIGFGPEGTGMDGANIIIGYVEDASGNLILADNFGVGWSHTDDESLGGQSDIISRAGNQSEGKTTIEFVFPLDSGDAYDQSFAPGNTYGFFVAYHQSADDLESYHSGRSNTISLYLEPIPAAPKADFSYAVDRFTVNFTDQSTVENDTIKSWLWQFGDGSNSTEQNPTHTFPGISEYEVKLTVTTSGNIVGTVTKKVATFSEAERFEVWRTQVAIGSIAIVLISISLIGIASSIKKEEKKR